MNPDVARSILFLAPQLYDTHGGIQAYMRRLLEVLSSYSRERGSLLHCLSLGDDRRLDEKHPRSTECRSFVGCAGHKGRFALGSGEAAWRHRSEITVVGHLGLAPVAWSLRRLGLVQSYILLVHGIEAWRRADWLNRRAARGASRIVAFSKYTAREFCRQNDLPPERSVVIPLALAEERIDPPVRPPVENGATKVLSVARLSAGDRAKGIDTLIEAVARAGSEAAELRLTVVGEGDDLPRLQALAARLEAGERVTFTGALPDARLEELYRECDVFAMPSRKEGLGIVFLEAMRFGKPCIGGNHGGTPELISHGSEGFLVEHGDVEQLAAHLAALSRGPELRGEMGLRGYEKVRARHLFPHMRDRWAALLDESAGEAGSPGPERRGVVERTHAGKS